MVKLLMMHKKWFPTSETVLLSEIVYILYNDVKFFTLLLDVLVFEQSDRENILNLLTEAAAIMKHEDQIQTQLIEMIWLIVEKINSRSANRRIFFNWSGIILGNILKTFLNGKDFEKSWFIIKQLKEEEQNIIGYSEKDCLLNFCELCLEMKDFEKASFCLKYAVKGISLEFQDDFKKLADKMFESEMLDAKYRPYVDEILQKNAGVDEDTSNSDSTTSDEHSSSDDDSDNDNGEEDKTSNV
ncbi:uncharacterized protein LOC118204496 [Stegodyphus dumicola]|uniref:uncharacterized protein LOC118204496 n=1 Tax=Stegodyphus dumicola TaxID=202533 RepID=UPI0015B2EB32|nr:uncharacterized protein LOC118204496 [Stegodyphus dumicola]